MSRPKSEEQIGLNTCEVPILFWQVWNVFSACMVTGFFSLPSRILVLIHFSFWPPRRGAAGARWGRGGGGVGKSIKVQLQFIDTNSSKTFLHGRSNTKSLYLGGKHHQVKRALVCLLLLGGHYQYTIGKFG